MSTDEIRSACGGGHLVIPARITVAGAGRGWIKKMVDNEGGKSIARARAFIKEIGEYKKEDQYN